MAKELDPESNIKPPIVTWIEHVDWGDLAVTEDESSKTEIIIKFDK